MPGWPPAAAQAPGREVCLALLRDMLRVRHLAQRCAAPDGGPGGPGHAAVGGEAVLAGVLRPLRREDHVVVGGRWQGHALLHGVPLPAIVAGLRGHAADAAGAVPPPGHGGRFVGGEAIVGDGLAQAVGLALADQRLPRPQAVTACFFDADAVSEAALQASLTLAAQWQVPVLFVCEHALCAIGTVPLRGRPPIELARTAAACGLPTRHANGGQVLAVHEAAHSAVGLVRGSGGPCFLELHTQRFLARPWSARDHDRDRPRRGDEAERWRRLDPIGSFAGRLQRLEWLDAAALQRLDDEAVAELDDAFAAAPAGIRPPAAGPRAPLGLHLHASSAGRAQRAQSRPEPR